MTERHLASLGTPLVMNIWPRVRPGRPVTHKLPEYLALRFTRQLALQVFLIYVPLINLQSASKENGSCKPCKKVELCKKYGFASLQIF